MKIRKTTREQIHLRVFWGPAGFHWISTLRARNRHRFPVDINRGTREELLRIPGIGYRTVARILSIRRYHRLRLEDLRKLRVFLQRAKAFLCAADHQPGTMLLDSASFERKFLVAPRQLTLFGEGVAALTGEL